MSMQRIRDTYRVPAKRGMRVEVYSQCYDRTSTRMRWELVLCGRITSASHHLHIDGGGPYHPRAVIVYFGDNGEVLCDTREDS